MTDYLHWHKVGDEPSVCTQPPECCREWFAIVLRAKLAEADRQRDDAVHAERRRVILGAAEAVQLYGDAAMSVLAVDQAALVKTVTDKAVAAIKATGCICPRLEVTTLGQVGPVYMQGGDRRCGMHEVSP